ncbi:phage tail tape measure protein [Clostridium botulinum]|uniref:phage tail tape measure protein n=1 Tax=Clostridium botulinum TaxID=1491 RepID=UPI0004D6EBBF|nr:phage tail tape measure protein [Clostridium botulinum]KEH90622.1 hypothetical protein Z963_11980 [Clostridium botulinum C/D str. It1]
MAKKEIYRLDIKIGVKGDSEAKKKLTATEKFARQTEKRTKALNKIKASPTVRLKDKLSKPLKKVESRLSSFSKRACSKLLAVATAGAVMIGGLGVGSAIRDFSNFEQGLANVKAITGATAQEMQILNKEAKRLGATTAWSAKDVTDAEKLLSQAGFKVQETVTALPGLLDLASAGELDLAQATDIAAGTLRAFGLEASKSSHVADTLALTASRTNSDVSGLGESLKYVAPVSKALGVSLEGTSAALGMLADANIKGSQSGTVLRAALSRLANPPKKAAKMIKKLGFSAFDAQGKMLPLDKVIGNLQRSMNGLTKQQKAQAISTIFGIESMSGMLALVEQGPEKLKRLTTELEKSDGAAKKMADTRLDSLQGQMTILKSAVEGMNIELGERLAPYAKQFVTWFTAKIPDITNGIVKIVDKISELAHKFNELSPATKKFIGYLAAGVVLFNPLNRGISLTTKGIKGMIGLTGKVGKLFGIFKGATAATEAATTVAAGAEAVTGATTAMGAATVTATGATVAGSEALGTFGASLSAIGGPAALAVAGIAALGYGGYKLKKYLEEDAVPAVDLFADRIEETEIVNKNAVGGMIKMHKSMSVEISKETKKAVGAYMELDKQASKALVDLNTNSIKFSSDTKKQVIDNFTNMVNKGSNKGKEFNIKITKEFSNLVTNTGNLTEENKKAIISKYTSMVLDCNKLTDKQKVNTVNAFKDILNKSTAITEQQKNTLVAKYNEMGRQINAGYDKQYEERSTKMQNFFAKSNVFTVERQAEILQAERNHNESMKASTQEYCDKITQIIQTANEQHRQLRTDELNDMKMYQDNMRQNAVESLSKNEIETQVILERLKSYNTRITAEQAAEAIKNAEQQRVQTVDEANRQFLETKFAFEQARDVTKTCTAEEAEEVITAAARMRDETVAHANAQKEEVVSKVTEMDSEVSQNVNTTTGEVISNSERMQSTWDNWNPKEHNCVVNFFHRIFSSEEKVSDTKESTEEFLKRKRGYASGTNYATSGIHEVAEHGFEIVVGRQHRLFNGGEKVLNHRRSKQFLKDKTDEIPQEKPKPRFNIAQPQLAGAGGGNVNVNVDVENNFDNDTDIDGVVQKAMQEFGYKLKEALKNVKR